MPNPQEQDKDEQTTVIKPAGGDEKPKGILLLFSKRILIFVMISLNQISLIIMKSKLISGR